MPTRQPAQLVVSGARTARAAAGRARRVTTGVTVRARRRLRPGDLVPGLLSVVVPCYNVENYLDECLRSLRFQHYPRVEIIVVDDGSPDRSAEIARTHQRRDPRIRIVRQPNGGLSSARNTGVAHARGEFLTFIDSDDIVQPDAFTAPISALRQSGSDFAVTFYDRIDRTVHRPADRHIRKAHLRRRLAVTIDEFPEAMVNAVAWSKTYRREFWDRAGLEFPVGKLYEDQPVSMAAYARARTFDVLPEIGVSWRIRHDRSSITQSSNTTRNLVAHTEAVHSSLTALKEAGHPEAAQQRARQVLANNMPFFVRHILRADDEFWHELGLAIRELVDTLPEELYARKIDSHNKMLYEFVINGRRDEARAFVTAFGSDVKRFPTELADDGVHCAHPLSEGMPRRFTRMSEAQLDLIARALRVRLDPDGMLQVEGWAYIRNVDLATHDFTLTMDLVGARGQRVPLAVETRNEPNTDLWAHHHHADYRRGGFVARVDTGPLDAAEGPWEFAAAMTVGTGTARVEREGPVLDAPPDGNARIPRVITRANGTPVWVDGFRRPLTVTVGATPHLGPSVDAWKLASRPAEGGADVARPVATDYELADDRFVVELAGVVAAEQWRGLMHVGDLNATSVEVEGVLEPLGAGRARLTFPLSRSHWGRSHVPLPAQKYALHLLPRAGRAGKPIPLAPVADLLDRLPVDHLLADHHATVTTFPGPPHSLSLRLRPPLRPEERGLRNQHRLREHWRGSTADRDAVVFRALYGEVANCNGLGVHTELRGRRSPLELIWSVADLSVPVPEGGTGLVEGTCAWHEAIARARYHMVNVHQHEWFEKPQGQVLIQTMHGYPYKIMGHDWWTKGRFPPAQVANFDRRAREWDYFVSPATYATPLLRHAFLDPADAHPEVLEIGYPRNDVLQSPAAEEIRRRTRRLLGVRDHQTVVMYAPTFRDYLSPDDMTAARVEFFDEQTAARSLGSDFFILVRGHAFNARANDRVASAGTVVDVTDYPDVNDLILASDAAVLDYSSLRFDYALTGKPMVFLVPDLEAYDKARGGVIDFAPTAPGPLVTTTREVVHWLARLEELRASTAAAIDRFRHDYADLDDGHASQRLVDAVFAPRGDA